MKCLLVALLALAPAAGLAGEQVLFLLNGTQTDVSVEVAPHDPLVELLPQQGKSVAAHQLQWLRFGQEAMKYDIRAIRALALRSNAPLVLQAHSNGHLYVLPAGTTAPVKSFPPQPRGFPAKPVKKVDLT